MAAHQASPSLGFSRQEHWSGLPFPSPMHESEKWKWSRSVVSNPQRPHGLQPSRLLHQWDFPGKSTGVGCHFLLHWERLGIMKKMVSTVAGSPRVVRKTLMTRVLWEKHEGSKDESMQSQKEGRKRKNQQAANVNTRKENRSNSS